MKIGILGSGGREHAICHAIYKSRYVKEIFCFPGNAGTSEIATNINIDPSNHIKIKNFIINNKINYVIVGPEKPLVKGIVDYLEKNNIKVFGPNKAASQLEGSKIFTKKLCQKYNIPSAKFKILKNINKSLNYIEKCKFPIVIKADGLASGKGVYICKNKYQAKIALNEIFKGKFGKANQVLFEEYLDGEEMSFFIISDGSSFKLFNTAQDHKKLNEGDKGPNTGGMGAYTPSRLETQSLNRKIIKKIIEPTLSALKEKKIKFRGFLYAGLMIVNNNPLLIEYNVRMGDPECQTILPKLKTDFFKIIEAAVNTRLKNFIIRWDKKKSLGIVLCSKGYPKNYKNNLLIKNLNKIKLNKDEFIFHAGTIKRKNNIFSNGGRVLNFIVKSNSFLKCRNKAENLIKKLNWKNGFYRKDIGFKVIND